MGTANEHLPVIDCAFSRLTNDDFVTLAQPKIADKFGPRSGLYKSRLLESPACPQTGKRQPWAVVTIKNAVDAKIHGCGRTAKEALTSAGLGGWLEDLRAANDARVTSKKGGK